MGQQGTEPGLQGLVQDAVQGHAPRDPQLWQGHPRHRQDGRRRAGDHVPDVQHARQVQADHRRVRGGRDGGKHRGMGRHPGDHARNRKTRPGAVDAAGQTLQVIPGVDGVDRYHDAVGDQRRDVRVDRHRVRQARRRGSRRIGHRSQDFQDDEEG